MTDREGPNPLATLVVGTIICPGVPEHEHKIYQSELLPEYQGTTASIQSLVDERNDWRKRALEAEALVKANEDRDLTPKNLEEFRLKLFNDPVAYAYYNMGAAVERDKQLSPEERTRKNWDAIYSAISCGFEKKILPDIWTAEFASVDKAEKDAKEDC